MPWTRVCTAAIEMQGQMVVTAGQPAAWFGSLWWFMVGTKGSLEGAGHPWVKSKPVIAGFSDMWCCKFGER